MVMLSRCLVGVLSELRRSFVGSSGAVRGTVSNVWVEGGMGCCGRFGGYIAHHIYFLLSLNRADCPSPNDGRGLLLPRRLYLVRCSCGCLGIVWSYLGVNVWDVWARNFLGILQSIIGIS